MRISVSSARPTGKELSVLFSQVGWGQPGHELLERSIDAYTATLCARADDGELIGYVSVFSDGVLTTMFGELVVHPDWRGGGVGRSLLAEVERMFPAAPIYVKALGDARGFFEAVGFRCATVPVTAMFKRPANASESAGG
ncbi:MAG: GNAT family N-acetyltransferase [Acidovorax sp.]